MTKSRGGGVFEVLGRYSLSVITPDFILVQRKRLNVMPSIAEKLFLSRI